ncbi:MAG: protein kinase [Ardenticatenia bacterium]|nr:protein kinase [Ardenticatenia bacterium]
MVVSQQVFGTLIKGTYRLYEEIGSGGMATVYVGRNLHTNEVVAVKVLHPHIAEEADFIHRFDQEGEILSKLSSPHIIRLYDYGVEGQKHFLILEYVAGVNLNSVISRRAPLSPESALGIAAQIAQGLAVIHEHDVIHRDIRPDNVVLARKVDGSVSAKIADFGIAKALGVPGITQAGFLPSGTPYYLSPEQLKGETDIRTDIYGLGVTLFEMLTASRPFTGDNPVEIALKIEKSPPPAIATQKSGISEDVEALVHRCLAKTPEERFSNASAFIAALQDLSVEPCPPSAELLEVPRAALVEQKTGRTFALEGTRLTIGRAAPRSGAYPEIDLSDLDPERWSVSRRHAQLRLSGGRWVIIEEEGAANGTWVNEKRLRPGVPTPLANGDVVRVARVQLEFRERTSMLGKEVV